MDVFLDHELLEADASSLSAILEAAQTILEPAGRIVVEVRFDDVIANDEQLDAATQQLPTADEVHLISAHPAQLCREALEATRQTLDEALDLQKQAADMLNADQSTDAMARIQRSIQLWQQALAAVTRSAALFGVGLEDLQTTQHSATDLIKTVADQMRRTQQHLSDRDHIGLADALAYEWDSATQGWHELIDALLRHIAAADSGDGA
jgi:hypothetical protein